MSTDRELLQAAAKAAGYELDYTIRPDGLAFYHSGRNAMALADGGWFAPLTDDGDALRLAVKLGMQLDLRHDTNEVRIFGAPKGRIDEGVRDDPYAATRRAIVRVAAALGEQHDQ